MSSLGEGQTHASRESSNVTPGPNGGHTHIAKCPTPCMQHYKTLENDPLLGRCRALMASKAITVWIAEHTSLLPSA